MWRLLWLMSVPVLAADLPAWVNRPPAADGVYHYYVGRSAGEKNQATAWRAATQDAYETAIRENFGVSTQFQASGFESLDRRHLDKRVDERSQRVRLEKFEQRDSYVVRGGEEVGLYLLFRYPIAEIEKERERLATAQELLPSELTEIGANSSNSTTQLRIDSVPGGAEVFINDSRWGVTPLLIKGVLPVGVHSLAVRHPEYQDVSERVVLVAGVERKVRKVLEPAMGWIRVEPTPSNARVSINGREVETAALHEVPAGQDLHVRLEHGDCETLIRMVKVSKNEARTIAVELPLRPDRQPKLAAEERRDFFLPDPEWYQNTWIWGLLIEISEPSSPYPFRQSTIGIGLSVERRFLYRLGVRARATMDFATEPPSTRAETTSTHYSSTGEEGISGSSFSVGIPLYLSGDPDSLYIMAEWGRISRTVPESYRMQPNAIPSEEKFSYPRAGFTLGYQDLAGHYDFWVSRYVYEWGLNSKHTATLVGVSWSYGVREPK